MAVYYIDLYNGNDSNNGTTWALAWKTITNGATAARIAPGDTIRISKTPDPVSIGNATWTNLSKTVTLATAQTLTIDLCNTTAYTASANITATASTTRKEGTHSCSLAVASGFTTGKMAYKTLTTLDASAYQKLSFWFRNTVAIASATVLKVCLCSDTVGDTIVDTFWIPAIPSTSRWLPLTITKDGGGNLGSSIQSIAIYANSDPGTPTLLFDDFIACTTSGLCLQSLISKNGSAQGGTEGYYGIQSINGTTILLDNDTETGAAAGRGYSGTTETVTTYMRNTYKTALASSATTQISVLNDSGTLGNLIAYEFGYEVGTTNQNGETYFDGLNGNGYGVYAVSKSYNRLNYCSPIRYNYGIYLVTSTSNTIGIITNASNNTNYGIYFSSASNSNTIGTITNASNNGSSIYLDTSNSNTIGTITNASNNTNYGIYLVTSNSNTIGTISNANNNINYGIYLNNSNSNTIGTITNASNNTNYGIYLITCGNNTIGTISNANNNSNYGISLVASTSNTIGTISNANNNINYGIYLNNSNSNTIKSLSTTGNTTASIYNNNGINYIRNATMSETTQVAGMVLGSAAIIWSYDEDGTDGNHWAYFDGGTFNIQSTTVHETEQSSWKTAITSSDRKSTYKVILPVGEFAGVASTNLTVSAWVKKDHATNIACRLVCYADDALGISEVSDTKADDTNWEQLSITLNSAHANPVFKVYLETWYVSGNSNSYLGAIEVS